MAKYVLTDAVIKRIIEKLNAKRVDLSLNMDSTLAVLREEEIASPRQKLSQVISHIGEVNQRLAIHLGQIAAEEYRYVADKLDTIERAFSAFGFLRRGDVKAEALHED